MSNGSVDWNLNYLKKDAKDLIGDHLFERVGLGKAPFRVTGYGKHVFQAIPGDPSCPLQPGTSCDYCGTGCMYVANIRSADGKEFKVGLDCVMKVGDAGLVRNIKRSPEYRQIQRDARHALDVKKSAEIERLLADPSIADQVGHFRYRLGWCGASGRARLLKEIRELVASRASA